MKKKIKKPKLTLIVNNVGENGRIYIGKYLTLKETKISDEDLKLRGFGEILGTRQSGYQLFKILDPLTDIRIMEDALNEAKSIFEKRNSIKKSDKEIINLFLKIYNTERP